ncbi:MAG TPA: hypothetical protein DDX89_04650 [Candidatus Omnitrophica bacterium]|nr:hypothetical protein [Candidatus Rokubacteria bacterium]HBH97065.1 hypothetical protein [Candidatus Omnitrophota bacterium]
MKYRATERGWVMRLLARLTAEQRQRYEEACRTAPRHPHSGKLYDRAKAEIAERILYEDRIAATVPAEMRSNTGTLAKGAGIEPARLAAAFKELER